jgi:hypothetical protein
MSLVEGRYRTARVVACSIGVAAGLVLVALSFLPGKPVYPGGLVAVLFVAVFPLFGWAVIERAGAQFGRPRRRWNDFSGLSNAYYNQMWANLFAAARRYRRLLAVAVPLVVVLWALMMASIVTSQGQPEHVGSSYYLDDHGLHIPVSRAGYYHALAVQDRLFACGSTLFLLVALGLTAWPRGKRDDQVVRPN